MTNFDFLVEEKEFKSFSQVAVNAEKILHIDMYASAINSRRAMEFAIKWLYSVDKALQKPYDDSLNTLISTQDFRELVSEDLLTRLHYIRKLGNDVAHTSKTIKIEQVILSLENLFIFMDFVCYCYGSTYKQREFDKTLLENQPTIKPKEENSEIDLEELIKENKALKEELTKRREQKELSYTPKPIELTEYKTRKLYIDVMLRDGGWVEGQNWINEVSLEGMPNVSNEGFADYVLYGDDLKPLAVVEAKKTCIDVSKGRQQAKLYADILEKQYGKRPVIFLTNGFDTRIDDGQYPERKVANIYSKRDLEKLFNLKSFKTSLKNISINKSIAGRYYQEGAIKAVCSLFDEQNRRKALLVMATGSGKTRTVIALCDVLLNHGWIKNILFLADRNSLITQAKRNFVNLLPNLSVNNLCEEKKEFSANCIFSTYQTMINCIDSAKDEQGRLFTSGHFDLIICDEAHRSIYNKYKDIFTYFDAPLVGLTATPKDEIDKNTYEIFELEKGIPTYGYDLAQAVKDGYLVDFKIVETKLKFLEDGISYEDLSDEEKEEYEKTFANEDEEKPEKIESSALNKWVFNEDTIKQVLNTLMTHGLKVQYGSKLGKTIIFAKNHEHAEKIFEVFNKEYPHLKDFAKVIDNYINYVQSAIDEFSDAQKLPQIAISVDMLDTGIDVPEVLNLVFFKKVMSKAKFWQMIGRGTRLCEDLLDEEDKKEFYIFDLCGNFEFFKMNKGNETPTVLPLQSSIFNLKVQMAYKLQDLQYQTQELIEFRKDLVDDLLNKVNALNKDNFAVKQHLRYVEKFSQSSSFVALSYEDTLYIKDEVAPLILPYEDEASAVRFDALLYAIELAYLDGKKNNKAKNDLKSRARDIASVANIPEIMAKASLLDRIINSDYLETAGINEFEHIRKELRYLIKYVPKNKVRYDTNFSDDILSIQWKDSELENDDLKNYKAKAEFYVRENQDNSAIAKLKSNIALDQDDIEELQAILWSEVGTKEEYELEFGQKPLGEFVREIVGLDMSAAKEAFANYLDDTNLDERQIYFVNQIVEYIVHNGMMKDFTVLVDSPFTDKGSVVEVFSDICVWNGIKSVIEKINHNAWVA